MTNADNNAATNGVASDGENAGTIDNALELLKQGKEFEKEHMYWQAADKFIQGREILQQLSQKQQRVTEEDKRIASLYEEKAKEYLRSSRKVLVEAMQREMEPDEKGEEFYANLADDEAELRIRTFYTLFSKKVHIKEPEQDAEGQQWSIEERLQELNASLPSGFKTDEERMDSINRGLNRLGLSLYSQKKPFERFEDILPKSEDEQIEEITAQATDQVAFEKQFGGATATTDTGTPGGAQDDSDDGDDSDDDMDKEEDLKLDDDQLAVKHVRHRVVNAQTKLAELVALLDEAKSAMEEEEQGVERYDSDDDVEKPSGEAYLASGKKKLRSAQRNLKKAMEEWNEALL